MRFICWVLLLSSAVSSVKAQNWALIENKLSLISGHTSFNESTLYGVQDLNTLTTEANGYLSSIDSAVQQLYSIDTLISQIQQQTETVQSQLWNLNNKATDRNYKLDTGNDHLYNIETHLSTVAGTEQKFKQEVDVTPTSEYFAQEDLELVPDPWQESNEYAIENQSSNAEYTLDSLQYSTLVNFQSLMPNVGLETDLVFEFSKLNQFAGIAGLTDFHVDFSQQQFQPFIQILRAVGYFAIFAGTAFVGVKMVRRGVA